MANPIQCNKLEGEIIRGGIRREGGEGRNEGIKFEKEDSCLKRLHECVHMKL